MTLDVFWSLGLAVAGIFITVTLSGVLAGLVSYGMIERVYRRTVQAGVVTSMLDGKGESAGYLARLLGFEVSDLYALPYRQLCGQLVARISADAAAGETDSWSIELAGFLLRTINEPTSDEPRVPNRVIQERALNFVDRLQIRLAAAVITRALVCSSIILIVDLALLSVPMTLEISRFRDRSTLFAQSFDLILSTFVAVVLLVILFFSALMIADLTFRWIDRVASSR